MADRPFCGCCGYDAVGEVVCEECRGFETDSFLAQLDAAQSGESAALERIAALEARWAALREWVAEVSGAGLSERWWVDLGRLLDELERDE